MDDDYYDNEYQDESSDTKMVDEAKAFERAGGTIFTPYLMEYSCKTTDTGKSSHSLPCLFIEKLQGLYYTWENKNFRPSEGEFKFMLEKLNSIPEFYYKNPIAYVLGYMASQGGQELEPDVVKHVIDKVLPDIPNEWGVTAPDVIRYARFWHLYVV